MSASQRRFAHDVTRRRGLLGSGIVVAAFALGGCAVEVQNKQAAQDLPQASKSSSSLYTGWRVFQDKCSRCHGPAANGTAEGPDLLPRVRNLSERRFVRIVLNRYDWNIPAQQGGGESASREALIEAISQRREGAMTMPAWQDEPRVNAHIADLYAYLAARAEGTQGPARPAR
jgi:Cytochrome C oxidase, cbb3-type, subunit III